MDPINAALAATPLLIEWIKERRQRHQELSADAFQAWLIEAAFPQMMEASQATFELLSIGQRAHHAELLVYLTKQFEEIKATLERLGAKGTTGVSFEARWRQLGPAGEELLRALVEQIGGDQNTYEDAQLDAPFVVTCATDVEVAAGRKRVHEAGLARYGEASNNAAWLRLTGLGYLAVMAATAGPEAFDADLERLRNALRKAPDGPIDKLVAYTLGRCTTAFVYAVLEQWDAVGWILLQRLDQREHSRLMGPAQALFDADAVLLRRKTLHPFLD